LVRDPARSLGRDRAARRPARSGGTSLDPAPGDWTERQRQLFREAAARGEERIVLIASDSPHLAVGVVEEAFRELDRHDLVFGPTYDGGYYLIGMYGYHDVLSGIPMSTGTVLDDITGRTEQIGLSVGWVETTFDISEMEDLEHLRRIVATRADLAATRSALETLGLHEDRRRSMTQPSGEPPRPKGLSTEPSRPKQGRQ
jgi:2-phospho-L-lactate guanylyltransferase (CobY/MobA/RfbA family)